MQIESWTYLPFILVIGLSLLHCIILAMPRGERIVFILGWLLRSIGIGMLGSELMSVTRWSTGDFDGLADREGLLFDWRKLKGKDVSPYRLWLVGSFVPFSRGMLHSIAMCAQAAGAGVLGLADLGPGMSSASIIALSLTSVLFGLLLEAFISRYSTIDACLTPHADVTRIAALALGIVRRAIFLIVLGLLSRLTLRVPAASLSGAFGVDLTWWALLPMTGSVVVSFLLLCGSVRGLTIVPFAAFRVIGFAVPSFASSASRYLKWRDPNTWWSIVSEADRIGLWIEDRDSPFRWWWSTDGSLVFNGWVRKWNVYVIPATLVAVGLSRFLTTPVSTSFVFASITVPVGLAVLGTIGGIINDDIRVSIGVPSDAGNRPEISWVGDIGRGRADVAIADLIAYVDAVGKRETEPKRRMI